MNCRSLASFVVFGPAACRHPQVCQHLLLGPGGRVPLRGRGGVGGGGGGEEEEEGAGKRRSIEGPPSEQHMLRRVGKAVHGGELGGEGGCRLLDAQGRGAACPPGLPCPRPRPRARPPGSPAGSPSYDLGDISSPIPRPVYIN